MMTKSGAMKWQKLGVVYAPDGILPWARSHAMVPTPVVQQDGSLRVYFNCLDRSGIARPTYVVLDPETLEVVAPPPMEPLLDVGRPGTFDENGVLLTSVVSLDDSMVFMYYVGFERGHRIRYRLLTGLAISEDGGTTFRRYRETPVLERSPSELFFRGGPFVLHDRGRFHMWYVAGSAWTEVCGKQMPVYQIKYLESGNGLAWGDQGRLCVSISDPDEHGFGRPFVRPLAEGFEMYYSIRKRSVGAYRLGRAISPDGIEWTRRDDTMGLDVSATGWDSQAIMYAAVVDLPEETLCFYNGNDFGRDGFGVARLA